MKQVVFTVAKRPEYFREVMDAWQQVRGIEEWQFRFFIEPTHIWGQQQRIVDGFDHPDKQATVNERILGVLENPFRALTRSFDSGSSYTILAEEDVLPSHDVLEYFAWARLQETDQTLAICASNRGAPRDIDREGAVGWDQAFDPLIWGLSSYNWPLVRDTWDHDYSTGENGEGAGWDWNLNRVLRKTGTHCIFPAQSRSLHIGKERGAHSTAELFPASQAPSFALERPTVQYVFEPGGKDEGEGVTS